MAQNERYDRVLGLLGLWSQRLFYVHAGIFVAVMLLLTFIDAFTGPSWWVQWPLMGWGIGLAAHALIAFGPGRMMRARSNPQNRP